MWTEITRSKYERAGRRYASDLTDAEWRLIEPYMPSVKRLGRPHCGRSGWCNRAIGVDVTVVPVGMWAKVRISPPSELAREAGGSAAGRQRRSSTYP